MPVTADDVKPWIREGIKFKSLDGYAASFAAKVNALLAEKDAEIARLRAWAEGGTKESFDWGVLKTISDLEEENGRLRDELQTLKAERTDP